jgi:hypothetical protein
LRSGYSARPAGDATAVRAIGHGTIDAMSDTSPSDLAVTFRSVARRLTEAQGDASDESVRGLVEQIDRQVATAASALGTSSDSSAVASAIEARHADEWETGTLTTLRAAALEIGRLLRAVAAQAGSDED